MLLSRLVLNFFVCIVVFATAIAYGQSPSTELRTGYPNKPIRVLAPPAGGSGDFSARVVAQELAAPLGQQVIVDNRPNIVAIEAAAKAPPDGYTLLFYGSGIWTLPFLRDSVSYDVVKDFAPITLVASSPSLVVVHPAVAANSVKELIALAKSKPGQINYGSSQAGSAGHLSAELFKSLAGVNIVRVPYKGTGPVLTAQLGGEVQITFETTNAVMPHVKAAKLRALAVTSAQPSALAPGLPTVAATLPGYESASILGMWAPAGTPTPIVNRLNQEIVRILSRADVKEKFFSSGADVITSTPDQFAATIKTEMTKWGKLIKDLGIREE